MKMLEIDKNTICRAPVELGWKRKAAWTAGGTQAGGKIGGKIGRAVSSVLIPKDALNPVAAVGSTMGKIVGGILGYKHAKKVDQKKQERETLEKAERAQDAFLKKLKNKKKPTLKNTAAR